MPALYKIFDEILVNAADNLVRDPSMDTIRINIDVDHGAVTIWFEGPDFAFPVVHSVLQRGPAGWLSLSLCCEWETDRNNGKGLPIEVHKDPGSPLRVGRCPL